MTPYSSTHVPRSSSIVMYKAMANNRNRPPTIKCVCRPTWTRIGFDHRYGSEDDEGGWENELWVLYNAANRYVVKYLPTEFNVA